MNSALAAFSTTRILLQSASLTRILTEKVKTVEGIYLCKKLIKFPPTNLKLYNRTATATGNKNIIDIFIIKFVVKNLKMIFLVATMFSVLTVTRFEATPQGLMTRDVRRLLA